jgi:hypothetical protein
MFRKKIEYLLLLLVVLVFAFAAPLLTVTPTKAADHAEAPFVAADPGADLADVYAFLDPNDNSKVILALDVEGFVVPAEILNLCCFPSDVVYRFEIENTGDGIPDKTIDITFDEQNNRRAFQTAHIKMPDGKIFNALSTIQIQRGNVNDVSVANPLRVTTDPVSGASFYAGLTDDPFFFDIVGFNRYIIQLTDRNPIAKTQLTRGRDSFAGFNIHMIALSIPAALLKGNSNIIGINGVTLRHKNIIRLPGGDSMVDASKKDELVQIDRMATPVINTAFILPIQRKDEFNATPVQNSDLFDPDIVFGFRFLRISDESRDMVRPLITGPKGDYLRLDLSKPNNSLGEDQKFGQANYTGFPNGRRPGDDVIDVILFFVNSLSPLGDNVNNNDVKFGATFPFFAPPHQPPRPADDDGTAF